MMYRKDMLCLVTMTTSCWLCKPRLGNFNP